MMFYGSRRMGKRAAFNAVLMALLLSLSFAARADAGSQLLDHLKPLERMTANFQQITLSQKGNRLKESSGRMVVARGNRFRWQTLQPYPQLVVADGEQVWHYDPGLEQVVIGQLDTQLTATPALLFGGSLKAIQKAFMVATDGKQGGAIRFTLTPRDKQAMFTTLQVSFKGSAPTSMRLVDSLGQKTVIDFTDVDVNPTLKKDVFNFAPPAGVDIVRQR